MTPDVYKIGDICSMVRGTYPTMKTEPGKYPLVVTAAFRRSASTFQMEGPAVCVPLISSTGHGNAALHRVHYQEGKFALANLLVALIPKDHEICDPKYLYHLLLAKKDEYLVPLMLGTANVSLKEQDIAGVQISLPSLNEQRRIVSRIESLSAKIDQVCTLREDTQKETKLLSPSAFAKAYDEAATIARGTETLEDLCHTITDGTHVTPRYVSEGVPFLSVKDITSGTIRFDKTRFITKEEHAFLTKRCKPERDDVLLTKVGTTGFAKAIDVDHEFSIFVSLALLKLKKDRLLPKFTEYMLNSSRLRELSTLGTRGVGNQNLVLKFICKFPMPAPAFHEQRRIVEYLDGLQAKIDALRKLQSETASELDALMPSILSRAFRGEL
jgi:type I restriction enzyme, S subunit